jgi:hypothetical protein
MIIYGRTIVVLRRVSHVASCGIERTAVRRSVMIGIAMMGTGIKLHFVRQAVRALPTLCLVGMLAVAVSGQSLWVSYTLPPCGSQEPARFYISTGGAYVGQVAVISITSKQALITDPNRQENPYRPTIAKGAVIQPGGMAQNITFDPKAMPGKVEVRVTLPLGSQSLQGVRFELEGLCKK